jgi:N-dimethylarginine dimethylaminohydrolase
MSNFTSQPRRGEEIEGREFFESLNYKVIDPPKELHWEGEADLKFVRDNIFVGGYGIRSDKATFEWMESKYNMEITKCHMTSERNYHFDCQFAPLNTQTALVCTDIFDSSDIKAIEKVVDIIDVPEKEAEAMACNIVRVGSNILVCSSISEMKETDDKYEIESSKIARLNKACIKNGLGLVVFNLSEFDKSGAALSCNVMHGNFVDFQSPNGEVM